LSAFINDSKPDSKSIGFVPTMGALHKGHLSLVKKALNDNAIAIVSIFVNPTQFDNKQDLIKYPRTLDADVNLLRTLNSENIYVYAPEVNEVYNNSVTSKAFNFNGLENEMEGAFRKGHFNGVGTIVKYFLELILPDKAYFGEKDFQQLQIIKRLVKNYNIPVTIIGCPILREDDGLALSSRNSRLTNTHRNAAPFIYDILKIAKDKFAKESASKVKKWVTKKFKHHSLLELEYFTIADENTLKDVKRKSKKKIYRAFIAVYAGEIRLIDNIALN